MRPHLAAVVLAGALIAAVSLHATAQSRSYPSPGQMTDDGGRKLHLYCTGKGSPSVILIAGGGAFSIDWALVQPKIAEHTRVCSYDCAGLGWSDPGPAEETVEETINDLHVLLHASGEKGPFILVGASIGGIYIQAYQRAFPEDVAGLVFSNSANRVGFKAKDKGGLLWELTEADIRSGFPLSPSMQGTRCQPTRKIPTIACLQTCRKFAYGSMCASGRSPTHRKLRRIQFCRGERNS